MLNFQAKIPFLSVAPFRKMELKEEFELLAESDSARRSNIRSKSSFTLALLGWLIIGSALNGIVFASLPLKLSATEWQLSLFGSILSSSFNLLIGSTLIIVAQMFNTKEKILKKWQGLVSRFSAWFVILLLLIIPLQFFIGPRAIKQQAIPVAEAINKLNGIVKTVNAVNSEPELRAFLSSLPNQQALPAKFDVPFPVIKQRVLDNVKAQINLANNNAQRKYSQDIQIFLKEAVRNTSEAILMAAAFSTLANLSSSTNNVFTRFIYSLL
jgi:hypothetical protein